MVCLKSFECTFKSLNQICKLIEKVIILHSSFHVFFGVLAVATYAFIRFAQDAHLETFTIFLLTITLLASASINMPSIDVGLLGALILFDYTQLLLNK